MPASIEVACSLSLSYEDAELRGAEALPRCRRRGASPSTVSSSASQLPVNTEQAVCTSRQYKSAPNMPAVHSSQAKLKSLSTGHADTRSAKASASLSKRVSTTRSAVMTPCSVPDPDSELDFPTGFRRVGFKLPDGTRPSATAWKVGQHCYNSPEGTGRTLLSELTSQTMTLVLTLGFPQLYDALTRIPSGCVVTYTELAKELNSHPRAGE